MAIGNYNELISATANWSDRGNQTAYTNRVPEFITLAEAAINRRLRVRQQLTTTVLVMSSGDATLPTNYLEWKRVTRLASASQSLHWAEPDEFSTYRQNIAFFIPGMILPEGRFTIEGETLRVGPLDDSSNVEMLYYAKVPPLSVTQTTNWLLTAHPDCYFAATMAESSIFAEGPEYAQLWMSKRDQSFAEIERVSKATQGQASMRVMGPTP